VDQKRRRTCLARRACKRTRIADAAADPTDQRNPITDEFGSGVNHGFRLGGGQRIEFARIAVGDENGDSSTDGPVDHRRKTRWRKLPIGVKRGDQNA
jgi:hypothetical protein